MYYYVSSLLALWLFYLSRGYVTVYTDFSGDTLTISAYADMSYNITYVAVTLTGDNLISTTDCISYLQKHKVSENIDDTPVYTVMLPNNEILHNKKQIVQLHAPNIGQLMEKKHIRIKLHYKYRGKMYYTAVKL